MAPKIVDKDERREKLALLVYASIIKIGIKKFSIEHFVKEQKIGKSSFYNYFSSKDEAISYVLLLKTKEYIQKCRNNINLSDAHEKNLYIVFDNYISKNKQSTNDLALYKEFFLLYQDVKNHNIRNLNKYYFTNMQVLIKEIIQDAINKKFLKQEALEHAESLLMTADGMMFYSFCAYNYDLGFNIKKHINNFLNLLGNK